MINIGIFSKYKTVMISVIISSSCIKTNTESDSSNNSKVIVKEKASPYQGLSSMAPDLLGLVIDPKYSSDENHLATLVDEKLSGAVFVVIAPEKTLTLPSSRSYFSLFDFFRLDVLPDPSWSKAQQELFAQKLSKINELGYVPDQLLKPRELLRILAVAPLDAKWVGEAAQKATIKEGTTLYRGMKINQEDLQRIFKSGLESPGIYRARVDPESAVDSFVTTDLSTHMNQGSYQSIFISTTLNANLAIQFANSIKGGYVLEISSPKNGGIDLSKYFGANHFDLEEEVSVAFYLPQRFIKCAYRVEGGKVLGPAITNPNFSP